MREDIAEAPASASAGKVDAVIEPPPLPAIVARALQASLIPARIMARRPHAAVQNRRSRLKTDSWGGAEE
jgi:hypothetical protein